MDARAAKIGIEKLWDRTLVRPGCWLWDGATGPTGYGFMACRISGVVKTITAHRLAYELLVGPVPTGLHLDHLCNNRGCVRPDHLEPVTLAENNRRSTEDRYPHARPGGHVKPHEVAA